MYFIYYVVYAKKIILAGAVWSKYIVRINHFISSVCRRIKYNNISTEGSEKLVLSVFNYSVIRNIPADRVIDKLGLVEDSA